MMCLWCVFPPLFSQKRKKGESIQVWVVTLMTRSPLMFELHLTVNFRGADVSARAQADAQLQCQTTEQSFGKTLATPGVFVFSLFLNLFVNFTRISQLFAEAPRWMCEHIWNTTDSPEKHGSARTSAVGGFRFRWNATVRGIRKLQLEFNENSQLEGYGKVIPHCLLKWLPWEWTSLCPDLMALKP